MKKIYLGLMVTAALLGGSVAAYADDSSASSFNSSGHGGGDDHGSYPGGGDNDYVTGGKVFFDGDVYTGSCKVKIVGGKNDGNTIFLRSVRTTALTKNTLVNRTDFSINLKDCGDPDGKHGNFTRKVKWTKSSGLYYGTSYLKNTDSNGAKNVAFALTNPHSSNIIEPGDDDGKARDSQDNGWDVYKYQVSYVNPTNNNATGGHVAADATYEISYD
ncbi:fimbrial protein [Pseudocitrobacter cyperus]|uniref:Fimbrial protein n=1 Tax=Pseudocitrobacter cyperus TaxID=3112843 RepID=A0ABV0HPD4_9ENTR